MNTPEMALLIRDLDDDYGKILDDLGYVKGKEIELQVLRMEIEKRKTAYRKEVEGFVANRLTETNRTWCRACESVISLDVAQLFLITKESGIKPGLSCFGRCCATQFHTFHHVFPVEKDGEKYFMIGPNGMEPITDSLPGTPPPKVIEIIATEYGVTTT